MDRHTDRPGQILMPPDYHHGGIKKLKKVYHTENTQTKGHKVSPCEQPILDLCCSQLQLLSLLAYIFTPLLQFLKLHVCSVHN